MPQPKPTPITKPKKVKLRVPQATTEAATTGEVKLKQYGRGLGKPKMPPMTTVNSGEGMMALKPVKPTKLK